MRESKKANEYDGAGIGKEKSKVCEAGQPLEVESEQKLIIQREEMVKDAECLRDKRQELKEAWDKFKAEFEKVDSVLASVAEKVTESDKALANFDLAVANSDQYKLLKQSCETEPQISKLFSRRFQMNVRGWMIT